ncbi:MAG: biotin carboxyl carrier domain-containing protein [Candidatus Eisenbacteria sp.]|nr:biotin carboxyl carrier domain-containing protein [Candidatus Eisenbacteria bacterium]
MREAHHTFLQEIKRDTLFPAHAFQQGVAKELITIKSPSEGIFYSRPSPDAPAYVEVGAEISAGTVLGLVEVMKCFNQIAYGGADLPAKGRVVRILAEDAEEVRFGQALFGVEPVS